MEHVLPLSDQTNGENFLDLQFCWLSYALRRWKSHILCVLWLLKATNRCCKEQIILPLQILVYFSRLSWGSAVLQCLAHSCGPSGVRDSSPHFLLCKVRLCRNLFSSFVFSLLHLHALRKEMSPLGISVQGLLSALNVLTPSATH